MAAVSSLLAATAIAGTAISAVGTKKQASARKDMTNASIQAENARERQMNLEADRSQRENFRKAQVARATALTNTTAQGASYGSALPGAEGQIAGREGMNALAIAQNRDIGADIFSANRDYAKASSQASTWGAVANAGTSIIGLSQPIAQIGSTLIGGSSSFFGSKKTGGDPTGGY